jgi:hypothetical protein
VARRYRHGILRDQLRAYRAKDEGSAGKRYEDCGNLGIGNQKPVEQANAEHPGNHQRKRDAVARAATEKLQIPGSRHRHDRHCGQIDAAADDNDGHA